MILKQEILALAKALQLQPTTIEKDYVLSWVLYGISKNPPLSSWLFKGGTCLKKCYFETYRFSEDLDFTVPDGEVYTEHEIIIALNHVAEIVYEETGINLKRQPIEVKKSINKRNKQTFTAKLTYLGPLALPGGNSQRIKFDITNDEVIADHYDLREVFHPYNDTPSPITKIKCYSVNEILAEKTRALYERQGRARDIYDIVNISRNFRAEVNPKIARAALSEKFKFIGIQNPSIELILSQLDFLQLNASWQDQLKHQVEVLPPAKNFYDDLRVALSWWIDTAHEEIILPAISNETTETAVPRVYFPIMTNPNARPNGYSIDPIYYKFFDTLRYAARNHLCILIEYNGIQRLAEPYSIKKAKNGNQILYAFQIIKGDRPRAGIRSYLLNKITNVKVTEQSFVPQYLIEL